MTMTLIAAIGIFHEAILFWFEYQWFIGFSHCSGPIGYHPCNFSGDHRDFTFERSDNAPPESGLLTQLD